MGRGVSIPFRRERTSQGECKKVVQQQLAIGFHSLQTGTQTQRQSRLDGTGHDQEYWASIPFRRENTQKEGLFQWLPELARRCFHSLQTGKYTRSGTKYTALIFGSRFHSLQTGKHTKSLHVRNLKEKTHSFHSLQTRT